MDISIVIPCYNRIELLKLTLKSVAAAIEGLNAEVILVDDGSEPAISTLLREAEFQTLPLKFIRQQNSGLVCSKHAGLIQAQGRYTQFLDSDDRITADKLTKQIAAMNRVGADVSYTDFLVCDITTNGELDAKQTQELKFADEPPDFYLGVQPGAHSPVYKTSYLKQYLTNPFIPVNRRYTYMGEVWMYYNLCVFPAKIIKINEPLAILINHIGDRMTNHWENLAFDGLAMQLAFVDNVPAASYTAKAKAYVGRAAFNNFRGFSYDFNFAFQRACLNIWRKLGKPAPSGGKWFKWMATLFGPLGVAIIVKMVRNKPYSKVRTISDEEFNKKFDLILLDEKAKNNTNQ